ncbi:MAG: OmpH family outer membrane protein [Phycisphaerales bacterium]|nr:OmpH family outer membrane protein [Phycisphaerales bacterium]
MTTWLAAVWMAAAVMGQSPPDAKVAVINLAVAFERYQMTRDLEAVFAERRAAVKEQGKARSDEIDTLRAALEQFKPGTADFHEREEQLVRKEIDFQVWLEVQERRLKLDHKRWLETIYDRVEATVAQLAKERGIDLVLTYSDLVEDAPDSVAFRQQILLRTVIYADSRIDLTTDVVSLLDADYQRQGGKAGLTLGEANSKVPGEP